MLEKKDPYEIPPMGNFDDEDDDEDYDDEEDYEEIPN